TGFALLRDAGLLSLCALFSLLAERRFHDQIDFSSEARRVRLRSIAIQASDLGANDAARPGADTLLRAARQTVDGDLHRAPGAGQAMAAGRRPICAARQSFESSRYGFAPEPLSTPATARDPARRGCRLLRAQPARRLVFTYLFQHPTHRAPPDHPGEQPDSAHARATQGRQIADNLSGRHTRVGGRHRTDSPGYRPSTRADATAARHSCLSGQSWQVPPQRRMVPGPIPLRDTYRETTSLLWRESWRNPREAEVGDPQLEECERLRGRKNPDF